MTGGSPRFTPVGEDKKSAVGMVVAGWAVAGERVWAVGGVTVLVPGWVDGSEVTCSSISPSSPVPTVLFLMP